MPLSPIEVQVKAMQPASDVWICFSFLTSVIKTFTSSVYLRLGLSTDPCPDVKLN